MLSFWFEVNVNIENGKMCQFENVSIWERNTKSVF